MVIADTSDPDVLQHQSIPLRTASEAPEPQTIHDKDVARPGQTSASFFLQSSTLWTDVIQQTDHNLLFLNCDFGPTSLGPLPEWNFALRMYASMVFSDSRAACVYWGPDKIAFCNDKFALTCGGVHPYLMGRGFEDAFPMLIEQIMPIFDQVAATGQTIQVDNILLFPIRNGFLEEMYFIGQFIPLRGPSGEVEGFYNTCYDSTARVLYERRRRVVEQIAAIAPNPVDKTFSLAMEALRENPNDITMALLYSFDELADDSDNNLQLFDAIGVQPGHQCAPKKAKLETDEVGLIPLLRKVKFSGKLLVLSETDNSLQATGNMFDGISWCGYGEPARDIVISSLVANGTTLGFLVQGTNPRRAYDTTTEQSIVDTIRQMETKWVMSLSTEQAIRREKLLELRAIDSESRLRHMAKSAPLGMCQIAPDETIKWANEQYFEITGHERSNPHISGFSEQIADDEESAAAGIFQPVLHGAPRLEREIRLKRKWIPPIAGDDDSEEFNAWILAISFPMMEDGKLQLLMGYVSDISHQKWAETIQARIATAAILAKRRQEEFIDTTSHEMRNPLSAITQLADGISRSLNGNQTDTTDGLRKIAEENVDAAKTILVCAAHQRRVIDDVLILSRLESHMLSIHPVVVQASSIVANAVKMLNGEAAMNGAEIEAVNDHSYDTLHVDYVLVDPSRLTQILVNLISNAIKFASLEPERKISVVFGAQTIKPPRFETIFGELFWTMPKGKPSDTLPALGPNEDLLYLYFCVQDAGLGMTDAEMDRLFKRFSQGTSKTHVTYGGSGLGLYICKQLAEKQGGGIGVASKKGEGSVFAFYVETRAVEAPVEPLERQILDRQRLTSPLSTRTSDGRPRLPRRMSPTGESSNPPIPLNTPQPTKITTAALATSPPARSHRVLLVEDNLINQKVLAKQLRDSNFVVAVANHGQEALEMLEKTGHWQHANLTAEDEHRSGSIGLDDIDIIFMDLEMPVMNGIQCCKEIRRREKAHHKPNHLPIIAITANVRQEQKDRATDAGMDYVLSKPFTIGDLIQKVDELLSVAE